MLSLSWGVANAGERVGGRGGGGAGKATFRDLIFHSHGSTRRRRAPVASLRDGSHLKEATITHRKAGKGQQEYLIIKMNDVIITGVCSAAAAAGGEIMSARVRQGRLGVQAAEPRRDPRSGDALQVRYQGQQGRLDRRRAEDCPGQLMEPSEPSTRELSLEEAVSVAILLQKNQQFVAAATLLSPRARNSTGSSSGTALRRLARAPAGAKRGSPGAHRAKCRARARSSGLVQQSRHRVSIGPEARLRNQLVSACNRIRSEPCERPQ